MVRKSFQIRDNFELYTQLLEKSKYIEDTQIELSESNGNWRQQSKLVTHDSSDQIIFNAAKQKTGQKYGLRIFIKSLYEEPVYYFDSDGPAHFNNTGSVDLPATKIDTPHINFYDANGVKCARRSDYINENVDRLQSDINFGMAYFCREVNLNTDIHVPQIVEVGQLAIFEKAAEDTHAGIDFLYEI